MKNRRSLPWVFAASMIFLLNIAGFAQQPDALAPKATNAALARVNAGQKQKLSGVVLRHDADTLLVRDYNGTEYDVVLTGSTRLSERKNNPFRGAKKFSNADLSMGLAVEIEGRGNDAGALVADQIKFSESEYRVAKSIESRVTPVEGRVKETEDRMTQAEANAQRLSGQMDELAAVANTANGGAKAAQETADRAMATANSANERITATNASLNNRISSLDEYEISNTVTINFKVGSAILTPESKVTLDEIAQEAKAEKGHVIQVAGFASTDGKEDLNRKLSQRRAEAVMNYLIEEHDIPQRRIVTPHGYGDSRPIADNATRQGRKENRRVEVSILVSKGLASSTTGLTGAVTPQQ